MDTSFFREYASRLSGWLRIRETLTPFLRFLLGTVPILVLMLFWIFLTNGEVEERIISPLILPSPFEVVCSIHSLWFEAELTRSVVASLMRVIGGFLTGLVIAFPLGVFMGSFSKGRALFQPLSVFGAYLPIPALVPLTMSLFGVDELQKVMFLALAFLVYLLPLFVTSLEDVDNVYLQTAYTLGAGKLQTVMKVMLPIAFPQIFNAMRLGFGIGWSYIILAEMVASERGLGHIIIIAQRRGPREHIYLVLVVIVLLAFVTDKLWVAATRKLFPYMEAR